MLYIIADMNTTHSVGRVGKENRNRPAGAMALGPHASRQRLAPVSGLRPPRLPLHAPQATATARPYHKLAYVHRGKPVCRFVRADCVAEVLSVWRPTRRSARSWTSGSRCPSDKAKSSSSASRPPRRASAPPPRRKEKPDANHPEPDQRENRPAEVQCARRQVASGFHLVPAFVAD